MKIILYTLKPPPPIPAKHAPINKNNLKIKNNFNI